MFIAATSTQHHAAPEEGMCVSTCADTFRSFTLVSLIFNGGGSRSTESDPLIMCLPEVYKPTVILSKLWPQTE